MNKKRGLMNTALLKRWLWRMKQASPWLFWCTATILNWQPNIAMH